MLLYNKILSFALADQIRSVMSAAGRCCPTRHFVYFAHDAGGNRAPGRAGQFNSTSSNFKPPRRQPNHFQPLRLLSIPSHPISKTASTYSPSLKHTMAPVRQKTRLSGQSPSSHAHQTTMTVPTKTGTPSRTPHNRSPIKKRKTGLTISQKQSLIGNLQLESEYPPYLVS